ncbi:MAG: elongation factor G [Chloroflexi bacterium]|nr:elongation factor G [Chloroflexota bacterium]
MKNYKTEQLRNVGLFSHGGAGKTSLSEAMLFTAGVINRLGRVDEGTTTSDYDPDETKRHISVQLSLLPFEWRGNKINVIDTPGYFDFVGEVCEAVRVVDGALMLFDAVAGIEVGSEQVWKQTDAYQVPRLALVNRIDRENADFFRVVDQMRERFGTSVVPIQLPIGAQDQFNGVIDLVKMKAYVGSKSEEAPVPDELAATASTYRDKLVESAAEHDDELISKYLEGEDLTEEEVVRGIRAATLAGKMVPVLVASATANKAVGPLMDAIVEYLPSPIDRGEVKATNPVTNKEEMLKPADTEPLAALVFKTSADPYVGKLTYFRVYSGIMRSDSQVFNANKGRDERLGTLFVVRGKSQEPISQLNAGEIGAVAKLQETATGDTLCNKDHPVILPGIPFPKPAFTAAVEPKTKADLDKLGSSLLRIAEEDPTLQVRKEPDTGETLLSGMGESHVDIAVEKMKRKFGVDVNLSTPRVPYKETITSATKAEYKHKKQTGGHGQYGHVFLEVEPQPRGAGFEFADRVVGGVVPKNYIPAVEKGVREALPEGILAKYPVVDVKVTLYDGSYHPVDSSEMAFKIASSQAFRKGLEQGHPVLLEPIMDVTVTVPEQYMGDVMGDLNTKRAKVMGMEPQDGISVIHAQAPLAEIQHYAADLRSITQGRGIYSMEYSHYEEVPAHIAQNIIAEAKKAQKE